MIALPILIPLAAAVLAFLARRIAPAAGLAAGGATLLACAALAVRVSQSGAQRHAIGGWDVPLGIALHADGLSRALCAWR